MSTAVLHHEPIHHEPAPARGAGRGPGPLLAARAEALFASDLSARREHTRTEVTAAIRRAIGTHHGIRGCAGEVAAAYGEHPETAARRMLWARAVIEGIYATPLAGAST
jgi:hypothetical protein